MSLRSRLIHLVLAAAVPGVLLAGVATWLSFSDQLEMVKLNLLQTTRAIAFTFDSELNDAVAVAEGLARSSALSSNDLKSFYEQARQTLPGTPSQGYWLVLNRADNGQQVLNTRMPLESGGTTYPDDTAREWIADVVRARAPFIKNIRLSYDRARYVAVVQVPVIRDGNVKYVLSYLFDTANMQAKLDRQSLPDTWLLSMFDRAGQRVVRTLDPGKFVMRPPAESLRAMMNRTFEGVAWTTSVEGVSLLTAIARGPRSGWTVALGVPQREILAPLLPSAIWTFIGGLGVTLFALLIATQLARRIARPMERLSRAAVQLGHEAIEAPPRSGVREIDDVGSAMVEAAGKLRRRTEERDSNVEALRELNATLENRVMQRTAELAAANRVLSEEIERRKRLEEALVHSQKLEAVGQLTGGIAHEFNNLLAAVISCFRLVERRTQETSTRELAARGREAGERGARLTQQLLAFSRKQSLNVGSVDLNAVVARMSELMHQTTGGRVHITTATDPNLWKAMADEQQIELCLVNLIFNARDAMPESGEVSIRTANLSVGASDIDELKAGDYVAIEVCDTGSGMDEATLRRAFEPFFTTKDVGKGTGLGLSMVYGTMRQLGGSVRLVSEPGRGTTAALLVPRAAIVSPRVSENRLPSTAHPVGDATVLLTDDDEDVRRFTAQMLVDVGYEVIETSSAPSGLEVLQSNRVVDVMIVDYAMPGMNGREMIERTRALRPHLPIIVFTGYADLPQDIGGLIIVRKPATVEVLAGAIQRCLARPVEDAVARRAHAG